MAKHDNRMPIQTALGYVEEARAASRKTASAPSTRASIR